MKVFKTVPRKTQKTDSETLFSAASHVSDEKRKRWLMLVTVGLKRLVNKLQNDMFSNTRTDMYSNSAAGARGARV